VSDVARAGAQQASLEARGAVPAPLPMSDVARAGGRSRRASTRAQLLCPTWRALHGPAGEPGGARGYTAPSSRVRRGARARARQARLDADPAPRVRVRRGARGPSRRAWRRARLHRPSSMSDVARAGPAGVTDRRAPSEKRRGSNPPSSRRHADGRRVSVLRSPPHSEWIRAVRLAAQGRWAPHHHGVG
jgi:hypothetical protein